MFCFQHVFDFSQRKDEKNIYIYICLLLFLHEIYKCPALASQPWELWRPCRWSPRKTLTRLVLKSMVIKASVGMTCTSASGLSSLIFLASSHDMPTTSGHESFPTDIAGGAPVVGPLVVMDRLQDREGIWSACYRIDDI
jgi:hypothetical protein